MMMKRNSRPGLLSTLAFVLLVTLSPWAHADDESGDGEEDPPPEDPAEILPEITVKAKFDPGEDDPPPPPPPPPPPGVPAAGGGAPPPPGKEPPKPPDDECKTSSNPVVLKTGNKVRDEQDFMSSHQSGLYLKRAYNGNAANRRGIFGKGWFSNFDRTLIFTFVDASTCEAVPGMATACIGPGTPSVNVHSITRVAADGGLYSYFRDAAMGTWKSATDAEEKFVRNADGGWTLQYRSRFVENYGATGFVSSTVGAEGVVQTFSYLANRLQSVVHANGSLVRFGWTGNTVTSVTDPEGYAYTYRYSEDLLIGVTRPGPTPEVRTYHYGTLGSSWKYTGISENSVRYSLNDYHADGLVFHSGLAGEVEEDTFTYGSNPDGTRYTQVRNVLGLSVRYVYRTIAGSEVLVKVDRDASFGCPAAASQYGYDAAGVLNYKDDFKGNRVCLQFDPLRRAQIARVEGLPNTASCAGLLGPNPNLIGLARKISTGLHPDWQLETKWAMPRKRTTWVYNGQPDPTNGNALANCVVPDPALPSNTSLPVPGKPLAVVCRVVEQATTDPNGAQGFNATLETASNLTRVTSYTYNQWGRVATATDPRGNETTYAYYADTSFTGADPTAAGHYRGDLMSVRNAKGHTTYYREYDRSGRVLKIEDANRAITSYSYWPQGRIRSITQGTRTTRYEHWPNGLLKQVVQPEGSTLNYAYDAAHRLVSVSDSLGNLATYTTTYDTAGQKTVTGTTVRDPAGALRRSMSRVVDALGRVQKSTGGN